jgi:tetratricopeptide (TPR) repeat protein
MKTKAKTISILMVLVLVSSLAGCQYRRPVPGAEGGALAKAPINIPALEERALKSPNDVKAWIALGNGLYDTSRWQGAIDAYQKALALDPKNVNARVDLGICYRNFGNIEKAMEELWTAITIDPNHKNARRNAGIVLAYDLKKPKEAVIELEKYLELDPDGADRDRIKEVINELRAQEPESFDGER